MFARMGSIAFSATLTSSSLVRFWIGCGTKTIAGMKPIDFAWELAACSNSVVASMVPGMPRPSRSFMSCRLHDVQDPQSAKASTTMSHSAAMLCTTGSGAGLALVGLA